MDNKAQGALEYLLLIGGAVLIAAIVIVILTSLAGDQGAQHSKGVYHDKYNDLTHSTGL
jgi:uncharacterized protein (UPF0333 family)